MLQICSNEIKTGHSVVKIAEIFPGVYRTSLLTIFLEFDNTMIFIRTGPSQRIYVYVEFLIKEILNEILRALRASNSTRSL